MKGLSASISKLMGISGKVRRMDSMMIESNIRKLSRMEPLYTCIAKLAAHADKINGSAMPDGLKHYADPDDFNRVIYHQRSTDAGERMEQILTDADRLLSSCESGYNDPAEYDLFGRCLSEQTIAENERRRLRTREDGGMESSMPQNTSGPEATFRSNAGKEYRGYAANLAESVGINGSVVTGCRYEQNRHSGIRFIRGHLGVMEKQEEQEARTSIVAGGAYSGTENTRPAAAKNVEPVTTGLTGKQAPDIMADFEWSEDGTKAPRCPAVHAPKSCSYMKNSSQCAVSFLHGQCAGCPHRDKCRPKVFKRVAKIAASKEAHGRAKAQRQTGGEEFKIMQGSAMGWRLSRQTCAGTAIWKGFPGKAARQVLLRGKNSSIKFPETLQLPEGPGALCTESGTGVKQDRKYLPITRKNPAAYYKT